MATTYSVSDVSELVTMTTTTNTTTNATSEFQVKQPLFMVVILSLAYGAVFVMALLGNLSVIGVVYRDKRFHSVTYIFIVNLAVADVLMAVFCLPMTLLSNIYIGWPFGAFMCKATPYLQGVSVCASVNTLAAVAVDRYVAICHVFRFRMTMRVARVVIVIIWVTALLLLLPWALYYKEGRFNPPSNHLHYCAQMWPREKQENEFFLGVIFIFCYALPLLFITLCYTLITIRVWNRDAPGITSRSGVIQRSKIKVVKMLAVVVMLFAFSWLPLYALHLTMIYHPGTDSDVYLLTVIPVVQWLGLSNSCMNPLVYCLFSKRIRETVRMMLLCVPRRNRARPFNSHYSISRPGPYQNNGKVYYRPTAHSLTTVVFQRSDSVCRDDDCCGATDHIELR